MNIIAAWQNILGNENVLTDISSISATQTATFSTSQKVLAIIKPKNVEQIQECIKVANQYKTAIYPISRGKNWGLGSKVPVCSNCAVMDLGRLNQILDFDDKLAYITVEPGVTFRQAAEFLLQSQSNCCVSHIGGSPEASLIGNTLERGDGSGYYGERLNYVCDFEVVLPTGELIHTGFGRFATAKTSKVHRWGVGPYLDGIFTQSNLGIVTKMTMWLASKPNFFQIFECTVDKTSQLEPVIEAVRELIVQGVLQNNCFGLWNSYKLLAKEGRYPWKALGGKTPFSLADLKGIEPWLCCGEIYSGSREIGLAKSKMIKSALSGLVNKLTFIDSDSDNNLIREELLALPSNANVRSTYWRKKNPIPIQMNPDRDRCGVIWICPALPLVGWQVIDALQIAESTIKSYLFEPNIAMSCTSGRNMRMFLAIMYDREISGEDERAMACHDRLLQLLCDKGYLPYRLGIQSMDSLPAVQDDYGYLIGTLKQGLDPNNILSPGRYDFRQEWSPQIDPRLNSIVNRQPNLIES